MLSINPAMFDAGPMPAPAPRKRWTWPQRKPTTKPKPVIIVKPPIKMPTVVVLIPDADDIRTAAGRQRAGLFPYFAEYLDGAE